MLQGEFVVCNHVSEIGLRQSFWLVWLPKTNILLHVLDPDRRNQRSYLEIYFSKYFIKLKVIFELIIIRNYNLYQLCWLESQNTIALYKDFGIKHFFSMCCWHSPLQDCLGNEQEQKCCIFVVLQKEDIFPNSQNINQFNRSTYMLISLSLFYSTRFWAISHFRIRCALFESVKT